MMRVMTVGVEKGDVRCHFIENTLEEMQREVGGYIQTAAPVQLRDHGIEMLVDEEGLLKGLLSNNNLFPFFYVGPALFVGVKGEEFVGLSLSQVEYLRAWLMSLWAESE